MAMFANRISGQFQPNVLVNKTYGGQTANPAAQFMPLFSMDDIIQAAYARAKEDHELDKLFNPDYYGDHGSGI
jgi:hypothetical protein